MDVEKEKKSIFLTRTSTVKEPGTSRVNDDTFDQLVRKTFWIDKFTESC